MDSKNSYLSLTNIVGIIVLLRFVVGLFSWLYLFIKPRASIYDKYNENGNSWAVVTGSSSGIGVEYAKQLASKGFNVLLVARQREELEKLCESIEKKYSVSARFVVQDIGELGRKDSTVFDFLNKVNLQTNDGDICMLVCNAGMSDLARHFTDLPLKRNRDMIYLNTLGNVALVQAFIPRLIHRNKRSCIITSGAVNAFFPAPIFGVSSANKHFLRAFSFAIGREYESHIDVLISHPIGVISGILKSNSKLKSLNLPFAKYFSNYETTQEKLKTLKSRNDSSFYSFDYFYKIVTLTVFIYFAKIYENIGNISETSYAVTPKTFVKNTLDDLSIGRKETCGCMIHEIVVKFLVDFVPQWMRETMFLNSIQHFHRVLERDIDLRPITEKTSLIKEELK